jgi:hypothetical protein
VCLADTDFYMGDLSKVPLWPYPINAPGTRTKWPGTKMTDMRPGSAWVMHVVRYVEGLMKAGNVDGVFLDATGAMTWGAGAEWDSWSIEEKDAYTLGNVDLVRRLDAIRRAVNPGFIIVNNSLWDRKDKSPLGLEGEKYVNGVTIEHHVSTSLYHRNMAARNFGRPEKRRVLAIANTQEDAREWAKIPGVTHVCGQATYGNPLEPVV